MSYSFQIKAENGRVEVVATEDQLRHVPDGTFTLNGHEDSRSVSLYVQRTRPDNSIAATAHVNAVTPPPQAQS